jgi:hypothetical protein
MLKYKTKHTLKAFPATPALFETHHPKEIPAQGKQKKLAGRTVSK